MSYVLKNGCSYFSRGLANDVTLDLKLADRWENPADAHNARRRANHPDAWRVVKLVKVPKCAGCGSRSGLDHQRAGEWSCNSCWLYGEHRDATESDCPACALNACRFQSGDAKKLDDDPWSGDRCPNLDPFLFDSRAYCTLAKGHEGECLYVHNRARGEARRLAEYLVAYDLGKEWESEALRLAEIVLLGAVPKPDGRDK